MTMSKNNQPAAFILSPEEYERLAEMEEDHALLAEAYERLQAQGDKATISMDEVMEHHHITQEDLDIGHTDTLAGKTIPASEAVTRLKTEFS